MTAAAGEDVWRKRAYQVRGLAAKGDPLCQAIFDWQCEAVAKLCREACRPLAFKKHAAEVRIETARAGDQAGCLGAALSAWQYVNNTDHP